MSTLINPPGIKTVSGLQMHTSNPPPGLAYVAAAIKDAGLPCQVIDGTDGRRDLARPCPDRDDSIIQRLSCGEITVRIRPDVVDSRYAEWLVGHLYTRRRWRKLAGTTQR